MPVPPPQGHSRQPCFSLRLLANGSFLPCLSFLTGLQGTTKCNDGCEKRLCYLLSTPFLSVLKRCFGTSRPRCVVIEFIGSAGPGPFLRSLLTWPGSASLQSEALTNSKSWSGFGAKTIRGVLDLDGRVAIVLLLAHNGRQPRRPKVR